MVDIWQEPEMYSRIIHEKEDGLEQIRLTVNTFRQVEYLHIRKYYLDFNEEWKPTPEGVAMPLDFNNSRELFVGLTEILSLAESKEIIEEQFQDLINNLYLK